MKEKKERIITSIYLTKDMCDQIDKEADRNKISRNEQIRNFIDRGLSLDAYKNDIDFIRKQIREELSLQLKPNTDRIMKTLMRIGMMAVTFSYFTGKIIYYFVPFSERKSHDELMTEAKKNAAAYLSMRDETLEKAYKEFKENN